MLNHTEAEEATLEHTPPLTRIYTPPSIKTLFPQHQFRSSFLKSTTKSIKTYTCKYNRNMINNLSDHTLTEDEFSVLSKGLSFVPTPRRTFQHQMNISWNKFKWIPPPSGNPTLVNFLTRTEQELTSINTPGRKTYSNLTIQEKNALNNLKNDQSIVIKPCDKSGGICIMNTRDYLTKIHTHLQDRTTYKPLTHNPTNAIAKDACTL